MYRIALNVSISFYRRESARKKAHRSCHRDLDLLQWKDHSIEERLEKLYKSIEILRPLDKALVILLLDNRQHKEIAEIIVFFLKKFPDKNLLATIAFLGEIRDMAKNN